MGRQDWRVWDEGSKERTPRTRRRGKEEEEKEEEEEKRLLSDKGTINSSGQSACRFNKRDKKPISWPDYRVCSKTLIGIQHPTLRQLLQTVEAGLQQTHTHTHT